MTEKRFTLIDMNNIEWKLISPIKDDGRDVTVKQVVELLNAQHEENQSLKQSFDLINKVRKELIEENEQLKKELYDITIDYYTETYYENSVRRDEHIKDFKEEFKAKYGDVEWL